MNINIDKLSTADINLCAMGYKLQNFMKVLDPRNRKFINTEILPLLNSATTDIKSVCNSLEYYSKLENIKKQTSNTQQIKRKLHQTTTVTVYGPIKRTKADDSASTSDVNNTQIDLFNDSDDDLLLATLDDTMKDPNNNINLATSSDPTATNTTTDDEDSRGKGKGKGKKTKCFPNNNNSNNEAASAESAKRNNNEDEDNKGKGKGKGKKTRCFPNNNNNNNISVTASAESATINDNEDEYNKGKGKGKGKKSRCFPKSYNNNNHADSTLINDNKDNGVNGKGKKPQKTEEKVDN